MPLNAATLQVLVTADTAPAQASLGAMNSRVRESTGAMGGMLGMFKQMLGAQLVMNILVKAWEELKTQTKDVFTKTTEWEDAQKQLNTVLISTGGAAGWTASQATALADSLSGMTKYNNIAVLGVENLLLTFTAIGKDIMPQATETVLDMATALGEDTKSASIQLGKALQDPVLGMTALRRVGVDFSKAQIEVVKHLVATGQSAKAQQMILAELHKEFGNSAKAAGETFAGQMAILGNQFDKVKETLGMALIPQLTKLMTALQPLISAFATNFPGALKATGDFFQNTILPVINQVRAAMAPFQGQTLSLAKGIGGDLLNAAQQLGGFFKSEILPVFIQLATFFATAVLPVLKQLADVFVKNILPAVLPVIKNITDKLLPPLLRLIKDVLPVLVPLLQLIGWLFSTLIGPALGTVAGFLGTLIGKLADLIEGIEHFVQHPSTGAFMNIIKNISGLGQAAGNVMTGGLSGALMSHLPKFAEGGVMGSTGLAMVGERGPEAVLLPGGSRVYPTGSGPSGGGGGGTQTIILQIDGRVAARAIVPHMPQVIARGVGWNQY